MTESVLTVSAGPVTTLTINRPESLNALNPAVLREISEKVSALEADEAVRVIVLTGAGEKAFVAGADIKSMADFSGDQIAEYLDLGQGVMNQLEGSPLPIIASVNGFALGGGLELALACDFIVASDTARVGLPEVSLGIIPGFGGTQRLVARAGLGVAKRVVLAGDMFDAATALTLGIVDQVVPAGDLQSTVTKIAETIVSRGPLAVSGAKKVLNQYSESLLQAGLEREIEAFKDLFASDDRKEGMTAFLEKRAANFSGK